MPLLCHDDVIKWKHFPRYCHFVRGIHRCPVNSPHKGRWRGALMFSLICAWINAWVNNREAGDLRRHRAHHDVSVMSFRLLIERNSANVWAAKGNCLHACLSWVVMTPDCCSCTDFWFGLYSLGSEAKQSGSSPKVAALFSATNFSSYFIELLQLHDTIQIKWNCAWIHYNIAMRSN